MPRDTPYRIPDPPRSTKFRLISPRGAHLASRIWAPNTIPKCLCILVHGGGWHSGYFEGLALHLTTLGIFVAAYDQVGCGYSDREPGSPPKECTHFFEFEDLTEDLFAALDWAHAEAKEKYPECGELRTYLLGESFGAPQVMKAALDASQNGVELAGIISLGGLLEVGDELMPPPFVVSLLGCLSRYYPKAIMPGFDSESTFDDAFGDKEWTKTARMDEKIRVNCPPTLAAASSFFSCGAEILAKAGEFPCPFLAVHGKYDVRAKIEPMSEFVDRVGAQARLIEVKNTTGHQLLQDVPEVSEQVIQDVGKWILDQNAQVS
mmetsp:Transcript_15620/g.45085  ORF Transcript_15620/g.45085 Transcript_15620/m.45085 type:complete len:320 (-) Transcript_15620:228-1187(-)